MWLHMEKMKNKKIEEKVKNKLEKKLDFYFWTLLLYNWAIFIKIYNAFNPITAFATSVIFVFVIVSFIDALLWK